jgi:hypothetical protein
VAGDDVLIPTLPLVLIVKATLGNEPGLVILNSPPDATYINVESKVNPEPVPVPLAYILLALIWLPVPPVPKSKGYAGDVEPIPTLPSYCIIILGVPPVLVL